MDLVYRKLVVGSFNATVPYSKPLFLEPDNGINDFDESMLFPHTMLPDNIIRRLI